MTDSFELETASLDTPYLWDSIQEESGIPSHGRAYAMALSHSGISPKLCRVRTSDGGIVVPYFERDWHGCLDICTWLSVSGARLSGNPVKALQAWVSHAKEKNWVAGYLQIEPESRLPSGPEAAPGNAVFLLNLDVPDPLAQASHIIRRKVRRAESAGVVLVDDRELLAEALVRLYPSAMARLGATEAYNIPPDSLRELAAAPEILLLGALVNRSIEAVMVFPFTGYRSEYFLGASTVSGRDLTAWLLSQAFLRLRKAGVLQLNLGGGVRPGDGLYEFKKRFGGQPFSLGKLMHVYDRIAYQRLCHQAEVHLSSNWFPAYRAIGPTPVLQREV
jgi:hypothetical protein